VSKSNFLNYKVLAKSNIALFCIVAMMVGFLVSRPVNSMAMILFGVNALRDVHPRRWLRNKWWLVGCCWVGLYAISYFWSHDIPYWSERFQVKLPILLLPLSFAFLPKFSVKQLTIFTVSVAILFLAGACYSVSFLISNPAYYIHQYGQSHVLPAPCEDDHIVFSMSTTLFIVWCVYFWPRLNSKFLKWFVGCTIVLLGIYLHILAAKSGLMAFYLFATCYSIYLLAIRKIITGFLIIVSLLSFLIISFKYIPTFQGRLNYIHYAYSMYEQNDSSGNYGDIGRLISYDIALKLIKKHPVTGVSAGDVFDEMKKGYERWYPEITDENKLLPHNQFLTVTLACGIPAGIIFCIWVFMPLSWLRKNRVSFFFFITWLSLLLFELMIDPVLEIQYGVFVYLFFILWLKLELTADINQEKNLKA